MKKITWQAPSSSAKYTKRLVFLRMVLGILLCFKGCYFIRETIPLRELLLQQQTLALPVAWLSFAVGWAMLSGGSFIVLGFFTRPACLLQLPVVAIALLIQFSNYTLSDVAWLELMLVFAGLILFVERGGGKVSLDGLFKLSKSDHIVFWA